MHRITFWLHQDTVGYAILREKQRLLACQRGRSKGHHTMSENQCKTHAAGHTASQLWQFRNRIESSTDGYLT